MYWLTFLIAGKTRFGLLCEENFIRRVVKDFLHVSDAILSQINCTHSNNNFLKFILNYTEFISMIVKVFVRLFFLFQHTKLKFFYHYINKKRQFFLNFVKNTKFL